MGGGQSWEKNGSLFSCKGYEHASENARTGNDNTKVDFNDIVYGEYAGFIRDMLDSDVAWMTLKVAEKVLKRTPLAVFTRAKAVKSKCALLYGKIKIVEACKPTGDPKEEDIQNAALALYNEDGTVADIYRYLRGDEAPSKPFPFAQEYRWYNSTSSAAIASMAEAAHKRAKLVKQALALEKKNAATAKMKSTMELFSMEGCCPIMRAQVFKKMQEKALAEILADGNSATDSESDSDLSNIPAPTPAPSPGSDDELDNEWI